MAGGPLGMRASGGPLRPSFAFRSSAFIALNVSIRFGQLVSPFGGLLGLAPILVQTHQPLASQFERSHRTLSGIELAFLKAAVAFEQQRFCLRIPLLSKQCRSQAAAPFES